MKKTLLWLGVAALITGVGTYYYRNWLLAKQFDYQFRGIEILNLYGNEIKVRVQLSLKNVSNFDATFKGLEIKAFIDGALIGKLLKEEETHLPADNSILLSFDAVINKNNIKNKSLDIVRAALTKTPITVDFVGKMDYQTPIGYFSIPITYSTTGQDLYQMWKLYYGKTTVKTS